jgi:hypothetical protein
MMNATAEIRDLIFADHLSVLEDQAMQLETEHHLRHHTDARGHSLVARA